MNNLNMKMQFVNLVLDNYEKKLKDFDINFSIINNLENQMKFDVMELGVRPNDTLDKKIEKINNILNKNLNCQFNFDKNISENNIDNTEEVEDDEEDEDENDDDFNYKKIKEFKNNFIGFLDFNKNFFVFYSSDSIFFLSKTEFKIKFKIEEYELNGIKTCEKIDDKKLLIFSNQKILFIDIINNSDYKINKKINFFDCIYDFNSNLDLLCLYKEKNSYYYSEDYQIKFFSFPNYSYYKVLISGINNCSQYYSHKIQFITNNKFFE